MIAILANKWDYNRLLDLRISELSMPEDLKSLSTKDFMAEERRLEKKGLVLRIRAGISTVGEAILCEQCEEIYPAVKKFNHKPTVKHCSQHNGLKPVED